jgi:hypothetical protein
MKNKGTEIAKYFSNHFKSVTYSYIHFLYDRYRLPLSPEDAVVDYIKKNGFPLFSLDNLPFYDLDLVKYPILSFDKARSQVSFSDIAAKMKKASIDKSMRYSPLYPDILAWFDRENKKWFSDENYTVSRSDGAIVSDNFSSMFPTVKLPVPIEYSIWLQNIEFEPQDYEDDFF